MPWWRGLLAGAAPSHQSTALVPPGAAKPAATVLLPHTRRPSDRRVLCRHRNVGKLHMGAGRGIAKGITPTAAGFGFETRWVLNTSFSAANTGRSLLTFLHACHICLRKAFFATKLKKQPSPFNIISVYLYKVCLSADFKGHRKTRELISPIVSNTAFDIGKIPCY